MALGFTPKSLDEIGRIPVTSEDDLNKLMEIPDWVETMAGFLKHQASLMFLVKLALKAGYSVEFPHIIYENEAERKYAGDYGIDIFLNGVPIDIKSFGLNTGPNSRSIDCYTGGWPGKRPATYFHTKYVVFARRGQPMERWEAGLYKDMKPSRFSDATPYFRPNEVVRFVDLFPALKTVG